MTLRAILRAYGLWLLGVLSAAAAAYFLYRSRLITYDLEAGAGDDEAAGFGQRIGPFLPGAGELEDTG